MAKNTQQFNVKAVSEGRDGKKYWNDVGRLFIRENDKGEISGSLYLHHLPGLEYAVFPPRPKDDADAAGK